ncbi:MAG: class I SAM-dependent methyltransferase [Elusimicrobia bacterium]|nr:class I SAM-dependent methyltransferase [Elusimicrobiota bacterium]
MSIAPPVAPELLDRSSWKGSAKMSDAEVGVLCRLVLENPKVSAVLELGALHGFSTVHLSRSLERAVRAGSVTTVDLFQKGAGRDDESLFDANCSAHAAPGLIKKVRGHSGDAGVLARLSASRFDLIFHDAEHRYEPVLRDILNLEPLLSVGGFFVFHDYADKEDGREWSLTEAVDEYFFENPRYRFLSLTGSLICFQKLAAVSPARQRLLKLRRALRLGRALRPARRMAFR